MQYLFIDLFLIFYKMGKVVFLFACVHLIYFYFRAFEVFLNDMILYFKLIYLFL